VGVVAAGCRAALWCLRTVSQKGWLLSRRLPADAGGFDTHRDSISSRFDCRRAAGVRGLGGGGGGDLPAPAVRHRSFHVRALIVNLVLVNACTLPKASSTLRPICGCDIPTCDGRGGCVCDDAPSCKLRGGRLCLCHPPTPPPVFVTTKNNGRPEPESAWARWAPGDSVQVSGAFPSVCGPF
jgi:hypothetical protein